MARSDIEDKIRWEMNFKGEITGFLTSNRSTFLLAIIEITMLPLAANVSFELKANGKFINESKARYIDCR